jgi:hypothetical protein
VGFAVSGLMGTQRVRDCATNWRSFLRTTSTKRSKVARVALPTQVRRTSSSRRQSNGAMIQCPLRPRRR